MTFCNCQLVIIATAKIKSMNLKFEMFESHFDKDKIKPSL